MGRASSAGFSLVRIVLGTNSHWKIEPPSTVVERLTPIVAGLCSEAMDLDLELAIETHCDLPTGSLIDLVELIDSPALGVVLDTANVVRIGEDLIDSTERLNPYVRMVHAKDLDLSHATHGDPGGWWPTPSLGKGDLDLESAFCDLIDSGFEGLVCVELGSLPDGCDEIELVRQGVQWLRDL
jgi:sugar phosphate isomerase/epimerase